mgnify:CR=1 FL=1
MNKYQEALEELSYPLDDSSCGGCKCGESDCHCKKRTAVETLQELVDKATPNKPIKEEILIDYDEFDAVKSFYNSIARCPSCKELLFSEIDDIDLRKLSY